VRRDNNHFTFVEGVGAEHFAERAGSEELVAAVPRYEELAVEAGRGESAVVVVREVPAARFVDVALAVVPAVGGAAGAVGELADGVVPPDGVVPLGEAVEAVEVVDVVPEDFAGEGPGPGGELVQGPEGVEVWLLVGRLVVLCLGGVLLV